MSEEVAKIIRQNEVMISLLARMAFKESEVRDIVVKKKKNPQKYVEGYNSCDGNHTVSQIADVVDVKEPTLVPILQQWEEIGIIYDVGKSGGKFYKSILHIREQV